MIPDTPQWKHLVQLIEAMGYGELRLVVQDGKPVRVEIAVKSIKLDDPKDVADKLRVARL